ncbi:MAG: EamA family transporter RarD [Proteobacteria bacterium]|nr:EamA family transporter RarD [Pseudomonadota bacterium]
MFASSPQIGVVYALLAFGTWGLTAIYFKAVGNVPPVEVLAHRVIWSVPLTALFVSCSRDWPNLATALRDRRTLATLVVSAGLIGTIWFVFVYAVVTDRVLHASLGYFINPVVNVVLGVIILRERLRPMQWLAVALALVGTVNMTWSVGELPWISLVLAFSFAFYGLLRKTVNVGPVSGLFVEASLLAPMALGYLLFLEVRGQGAFSAGGFQLDLLLVAAGPITVLPLVWFTSGARRLRYATIGVLLYLSPTLQFLLAVVVYREPFTHTHVVTFAFIWTGLAVFVGDSLMGQKRHRKGRPARESS